VKSIWHNPRYNTWLVRTGLKAVAGFLFVLALAQPLLGISGRILFWSAQDSLIWFAWGTIVFSVYYSFERARRTSNPDWIM
jgi:hypothetical protein